MTASVTLVPAAPKVQITLSANKAHALLNFLNQFFIPKAADSGLASVREQLREASAGFVPNSTYRGVPTITANRGTKAFRIG